MAIYMPPWLDQRPHSGPKHKRSRLVQILIIAAAVGLVSFLAFMITAILTAGGG